MGPLAGVRVIEFEAIGPGPFCAMMLADMGADVLLVDRVDDPRLGFERERRHDVMLRGRRSVTLDIKAPQGVAVALGGPALGILGLAVLEVSTVLPAVLGVRADEFDQLPVSDRKRHSGQGHYGLSRFFAVVRDLLVLRFVMRGMAETWLPAINGLCVIAGFFLVAALQLWSKGHHGSGSLTGSVAGLTLAYGLTVRCGLLRWLQTQATPPYRLRDKAHAFAQTNEAAPVERRGTPAGGVRAWARHPCGRLSRQPDLRRGNGFAGE